MRVFPGEPVRVRGVEVGAARFVQPGPEGDAIGIGRRRHTLAGDQGDGVG